MRLIRLRSSSLFSGICAVTLAAFAGCASSTVIQSQPPGARVLVNGQAAGTTPYTLSDTKIVGSTTHVRLEYPGYRPLDTMVTRNEELDVLALVGGLFVLVPFLWVMKYSPSRTFQLTPLDATAAAPGLAPPGHPAPAAAIGPAGYPAGPAGYPAAPAGSPAPSP
jgi:hypothetical protein